MLEIIYQDEYFVAINKPHGLLVHQSAIARNAEEFALQLLRDQINRHVWPAHRLDRKTGGVLLFSLDKESDKQIQKAFMENQVKKTYLALVRGFTHESGTIDYPLKKENGDFQKAITHFSTLKKTETHIASGKFPTSRYSLVEVYPETGRMHQIRRHFAHIFHPIIGDRPHGCNKQNRLFKELFQMETMLLHAKEISFIHPFSKQSTLIRANLQNEFNRTLSILNMEFQP